MATLDTCLYCEHFVPSDETSTGGQCRLNPPDNFYLEQEEVFVVSFPYIGDPNSMWCGQYKGMGLEIVLELEDE